MSRGLVPNASPKNKGLLAAARGGRPGRVVISACRFCLVLGMLLALCQVLVSPGFAATPKNPQVVIINSYHPGLAWSDGEKSGFLERLREVYPDIDVPVEFLDAKRHPGAKNLAHMKDFLLDKYRRRKMNLIVAFDNPALNMLIRYRQVLFPQVPVVFGGISNFRESMLKGRKKVTGVAEMQDVKGTLELALSLHSGIKEVLVVDDYTVSGIAARRDMEPLVKSFEGKVKIRFLPPSTFREAKSEIDALSGDALVLILSFYTDRVGRTLPLSESTRIFTSGARVPVYGLHEGRLGWGIVGGYLLGGRDQGRRAADIALRILAGEAPNTIPVDTKSTAKPMFDYGQLRRFGVSLGKLPPASVVIHQPDSIFEKYRGLVLGTIWLVVSLVGMVIYLIVSIIRRQRAEKNLRQYERIVGTTQDIMALVNRDYVYETVNERFLALRQKPREQVVAHKVPEVLGETIFLDTIKPHLDRAFWGRTVHYLEAFDVPHLGRRFMDVNYFPIFDEKGDVEGVVLNARDVTETKKLEEQLIQSQKIESLGILAGGVAHEINNPINGIMNYAELILDRLEPDNLAREDAQEILRETQRIARIVKNLLTFARHEQQSHSPARLSDIVSAVLSLIQAVMRHDQIDLDLNIPEDLPRIRCRSHQIQQVLMNLMTNARDSLNQKYPGHSPEKKIRVFAGVIKKNGDPILRTTVEDSGMGIPVEIRDRIFDPFFTTKPKETGTGLGLSISYGIVRDHGGELSLESQPGRYTRFYLDLPVDDGDDPAEKQG